MKTLRRRKRRDVSEGLFWIVVSFRLNVLQWTNSLCLTLSKTFVLSSWYTLDLISVRGRKKGKIFSVSKKFSRVS